MKKTTVVNIFNFVRRAHEEPSKFIQDDFDTIKNQMMLLKQLGLPSTYALKHDALIDPVYQQLFLEETDAGDEIAAWWEITGELCRRAGVRFLGERSQVHDDRVATAYCLGYTPEERKRLVDAYMADFLAVFGYYPKTLGSWVVDIVTFSYAKEKYGVIGGALCRDQIGTDGFTLWGGYVNGAYYPSRKNEMIPAQTLEEQLHMPVFRLLGPDPIYSFEEGWQPDIAGVYSLEPSCVVGRNDAWVTWMFERLTREDGLGMSYAQVGQENNFLWENIRPGFGLQLEKLKKLSEEGRLRIETLAETAAWFLRKYQMTPPATYQASKDWNEALSLKTLWYCSRHYRISFLQERDALFIRDWFVYNQAYPSRYLEEPLREQGSVFDALPLLHMPAWKKEGNRPRVELVRESGELLCGKELSFHAGSETEMELFWQCGNDRIQICLQEDRIRITGGAGLRFSCLPVLQEEWKAEHTQVLRLCYRGFSYQIRVTEGRVEKDEAGRICLLPLEGALTVCLAQRASDHSCFTQAYLSDPVSIDTYKPRYLQLEKNRAKVYPAAAPHFVGGDRACLQGETYLCRIQGEGEIFYTLDGSEPDRTSLFYEKPLEITADTVVKARCFRKGFLESPVSRCRIFFGLPVKEIVSNAGFDPRKVFNRNGAWDLLDGRLGSLDYQDGRWLGTTEDLDVVLTLPKLQKIHTLRIGFLSHHRSGIIYPDQVTVYAGADEKDLKPVCRQEIPCVPGEREIERMDVVLPLEISAACLRVVAHNVKIQPQWACYHGLPGAFLMADSIILQ